MSKTPRATLQGALSPAFWRGCSYAAARQRLYAALLALPPPVALLPSVWSRPRRGVVQGARRLCRGQVEVVLNFRSGVATFSLDGGGAACRPALYGLARVLGATMSAEAKPFWASKTIWWNLLSLLVMALALPDVVEVVPPRWIPYMGAFIAVGNLALRSLTDRPLRRR